jgi:hypothetical protein
MKNIRNIFASLILVTSLLYGFLYGLYPIIKKMLNNKETFSVIRDPLTPGMFPQSVSKPILNDFYPLQDISPGEGVSANTSTDNFLLYPSFPAAHCGTNNKRFWTIPDNGLCSRAEMCETLYNKKTIRKPLIKPPTIDGGVRVNYFNSEVSLPI